ncbi:MAG: PAS domain-containing protein [Candidatus Binatia bacterium]|nr:PAS domain-containing protein [Candidatus Binatia bacterium]
MCDDETRTQAGQHFDLRNSALAALRAFPDPWWLLDDHGKILFASDVLGALLGLQGTDCRGLTLAELWQRVGARVIHDAEVLQRWSGASALVEWRTGRGEQRRAILRETVVAAEGEPVRVAVLHEVSACLAEHVALAECRDRFAAFMEHLPGVAYMKDPAGRYVYVSPTFERHFGKPPDAYVGKRDAEVWPAEVVEQLRASDAAVLERRSVVQTTERVPQADGLHYWLATKFPILSASGEVVLIGGVAVDVTEERRALESLKELQRSAQQRERLADVGAITAQILHDLANPIAGLSMQVQLLLRRAARDPNRPVASLVQSLGRLLAEVQRLDALLREFKDFAREQRLELQPLRLRAFLGDCIAQWRPVARSRDIGLVGELSPDLPVIRADAEQLRRVMDNLVKNAIEAIDRGPGTIWLRSAPVGSERVRISVADDGPGIASHIDPFRLFETTKPYGTGLGLPIVRQIVEAHGGRIAFEPREPRGVTFHIDLPQHGPAWPTPPTGFVGPR